GWRARGTRAAAHDRRSRVATLAYLGFERDLAEERHAQRLRHAPASAAAEDVMLLRAFVTHEITHVLHDPEHGHVHAAEHAQALLGVEHAHVLRRGDDHRARKGRVLRERDLHVAG